MSNFQHAVAVSLVLGLFVFAQPNRTMAADPDHQKPAVLDRTIKVTMKYLLYQGLRAEAIVAAAALSPRLRRAGG
jgi:hypothetical protein